MGLIKNQAQIRASLGAILQRREDWCVAVYRRWIWALFLRILETTPQFSGKAVANWNIGIDRPNFRVYESGEELEWGSFGGDRKERGRLASGWRNTHQMGDMTWIQVAINRNQSKVFSIDIKRTSKVYISNGVTGDNDGGKLNTELYLEALQNSDYWTVKLREDNRPYETVAQVVATFGQSDVDAVKFTSSYTRIRS